MQVLLVKYNKVTNDAFDVLSKTLETCKWADVSIFGENIDCLSYSIVDRYLQSLKPFDVICVGDVFWDTGQHICKWSQNNKVRCYFLQHGQWIYTKNKSNPRHLPYGTFVYGDNVCNMMHSWPYSRRSKVYVTGNPRYDASLLDRLGNGYVYFSPPVSLEIVPSAPDRLHRHVYGVLSKLRGLDESINLVIHPHYREGNVQQLRQLFPKAKFEDPMNDPMLLIQQSEAVLTHRNSTTVLDAISCGKVAMLTDSICHDRSFFNPGYFGEFAVECRTKDDCVEAVMKLQDKKIQLDGYEHRAKPYLWIGNASNRIADIIGV